VIGRRAVLLGAGAGFLTACAAGAKRRVAVPTTTLAPTATTTTTTTTTGVPSGPATYVAAGPATSTGVALTFHTAGDAAITQSLLDQAAQLDARLTFFIVGQWAAANPGIVAAILAGGHELGNHTWSHIDLPALPIDEMHSEIRRCADVLRAETGSISKWFRPSQTDVPSEAILVQAGLVGYPTSLGYDIDPLDYTDPGAAVVESRVGAKLHGGAIVSLHTLYEGTATAFGPIIAKIRATGLEPVTASAIFAS